MIEAKNSGMQVTFTGMISLLNFITVYQLDQQLLGAQREEGDLIRLLFTFGKESGLKQAMYLLSVCSFLGCEINIL
jgi:hypothetical protein